MSSLLDTFIAVLTTPDEVVIPQGRGVAQRLIPAPRGPVSRQVADGPTEQAVAAIWRELLGHDDFGATDNFFDVGGKSLTLVRLQARLATMGRQVPVVELFRLPTVRALAAHLDRDSTTGAENPALVKAAARAQARAAASRRRELKSEER
jgi:aryl carrier-like protein